MGVNMTAYKDAALWTVIATLVASCEGIPDEVQVQTSGSSYDYLGGDSNVCLKSMDGESYGVSVTAIYKLKPQKVQIVEAPNPGAFINKIREETESFGREQVSKVKDATTGLVDKHVESISNATSAVISQPIDEIKAVVTESVNEVVNEVKDQVSTQVVVLVEEGEEMKKKVKEIKPPSAVEVFDAYLTKLLDWKYVLYLLPLYPLILLVRLLLKYKWRRSKENNHGS